MGNGVPLDRIEGFPPLFVAALRGHGVTDAFELVALVHASPEAREGVRSLSGLDEAGLADLLDRVERALGADRAGRARERTDLPPMGLKGLEGPEEVGDART